MKSIVTFHLTLLAVYFCAYVAEDVLCCFYMNQWLDIILLGSSIQNHLKILPQVFSECRSFKVGFV